MEGELILVVDDSAANRYFFHDSLQEAGYRVGEASCGTEAFAFLEREIPDLILLDVHLPGVNGLEICTRLKNSRRFRHIPVIQTSAIYTRPEDYSTGVESGADGYIVSPVDPQILISKVKSWIRSTKKFQSLREHFDSERERQARELEWLARIIGVIPFPIMVLDESGAAELLNASARRFLDDRMTPGDGELFTYGKDFSFENLELGGILSLEELGGLAEGGEKESPTREILMHCGDENCLLALGVRRIVSVEGLPRLLLTFMDISSLYESNLLVNRTILHLKKEKLEHEQFVSGLAHDLRTPLSTVKVSTDALRLKLQEDPVAASLLLMMEENIGRIGDMIDSLLDARLVLAGNCLPVKKQHCDLNRVISGTIREMRLLHGDRFVEEVAEGMSGECDPAALRRILENVLNNAVKYGSDQKPVTIKAWASDVVLHLSVHNHGAPIAAEELQSMFEPFRRAPFAHAGRKKGWGLGLTVVKGLLEAHGGTIDVRSDADSGTTFNMHLPLGAGKA